MTLPRRRIVAVASALSLLVVLFCLGEFAGLRLNLTPSYPLGLWRIDALGRSVAIGDVVFICPPPTPEFAIARARGYLLAGSCAGGLSPLIKKVVAGAAQDVRIGSSVAIDGRDLAHSDVLAVDAAGRPLTPWRGGIVPAGQIFLHSDFAGSYDSRYFGPLPVSGILGRAVPVFTFGG
jgi:conjugative transfer signal peptidase TraF